MKRLILILFSILGAVLVGAGLYLKSKGSAAIAVIGGADGPTSVFIAGKLSDNFSQGILIVGAALLCIAALIGFILKKKGFL